MRNLMLACAGVAVVSGVVSANLWRELRSERELAASLRQRLEQAERESSTKPEVVTSFAPMQAPDGQDPSPPAAASTAAKPDAPRPEVPRFLLDQMEMLKDPEYRKARLAQERMSILANYPGLIEELGLTREEADKLFDTLAEYQVEMSSTLMARATINGVPPDPAAAQQAAQRVKELTEARDLALQTLLGAARYTQWQDYEQTQAARLQVNQLARTFEGIGMPLSAAQTRPLTQAYVAEDRRRREELQRTMGSLVTSNPADRQRMLEETLRFQAESNRRIVEAARPHLSEQQLETLQATMEQQLAMNRASSRAMRTQMEAQGSSAGQAPVVPLALPPGGGAVSIVIGP